MKHNNLNNKKNNSKVTRATTLVTLSTIRLIVGTAIIAPFSLPLAEAFSSNATRIGRDAKAPVVISGDNIYIAWWTNNTANSNEEVMFRASTDGGATFGDRINLSNTTDADSWRVEIAGEGENVVVTWWETNQTSDIPVARISTDAGETFSPSI